MGSTDWIPDRLRGVSLVFACLLAIGGVAGPASAQRASANGAGEGAEAAVARAVVTREIQDREPGPAVERVPTDAAEIFFFTELRALDGQTITHRWEHAGAVLAEVPFDVRGARWRVYSSKKLLPGWTGTWTVSVVDASGQVLASQGFQYGAESDAE